MARRDDDDRLGTARDEAERLIAAALAAASFASRQAARRSRERERGRRDDSLGDDLAGLAGAATRLVGDWFGAGRDRDRRRRDDRYDDQYDGYGRRNDTWDADRDRAGNGGRRTAPAHHIANGSEACCSCPVCRAIDFVREPSPEFVERVATGASDLASGVTSMLRAFGDVTGVGRGPRQHAGGADVIDDYPPRYPTEPTMAEPVTAEPTAAEPTMPEPEQIGESASGADSTTDVPGASEPAHTVPPTPTASRRFGGGLGADFSSVWQAATRAPMTDPPRRAPHTPKPMAKKAVKAPAGMASEPPVPPRSTGSPTGATPPAATKRGPAKAPAKSTPTKAPTKSTQTKATRTKATPKTAGTKATGTVQPKATSAKATSAKATSAKATSAKATSAKATSKTTAAGRTPVAKTAGTKAPATTTTATTTKTGPRKTAGAKAATAATGSKTSAARTSAAKAAARGTGG